MAALLLILHSRDSLQQPRHQIGLGSTSKDFHFNLTTLRLNLQIQGCQEVQGLGLQGGKEYNLVPTTSLSRSS